MLLLPQRQVRQQQRELELQQLPERSIFVLGQHWVHQLPGRRVQPLLGQLLVLLLRRWQLLYGGRERLLLLPRGAHQQQLQLLLLHHKLPQRLVPVWQ